MIQANIRSAAPNWKRSGTSVAIRLRMRTRLNRSFFFIRSRKAARRLVIPGELLRMNAAIGTIRVSGVRWGDTPWSPAMRRLWVINSPAIRKETQGFVTSSARFWSAATELAQLPLLTWNKVVWNSLEPSIPRSRRRESGESLRSSPQSKTLPRSSNSRQILQQRMLFILAAVHMEHLGPLLFH